MKIINSLKSVLVLMVGFLHYANASHTTNMADYIHNCCEHKKESVLIVGCGHTVHPNLIGNHLHQDAYCVDVDNPNDFKDPSIVRYKPSSENYSHWQFTHADACLDITAPLPCVKKKFNTVVLERIWSKSLELPYTLYNSANLLVDGGLLIIDLHNIYDLKQYQFNDEKLLLQQVNNSTKFSGGLELQYNFSYFGFYDTMVSSDEIKLNLDRLKCRDKVESQLKRFNYDLNKRPKMRDLYNGLVDYLNNWGFENVIYINDRVQPYTFDSASPGVPGRRGDFIIATKSVLTTQSMPEWFKAIQRFSKKKQW